MPAPALEAAAGAIPAKRLGRPGGHCRGGAVSGLRRGLLHHRRGAQGRRRPVYLKNGDAYEKSGCDRTGGHHPGRQGYKQLLGYRSPRESTASRRLRGLTRRTTKQSWRRRSRTFRPADYYTDKSEMRRTDLFAQYAMARGGAGHGRQRHRGENRPVRGSAFTSGSGIGGMSHLRQRNAKAR